jgi:outer membrane protein TolC
MRVVLIVLVLNIAFIWANELSDTIYLTLDSAQTLALKQSLEIKEANRDQKTGLFNFFNYSSQILPNITIAGEYSKTPTLSDKFLYQSTLGVNQLIFSPEALSGIYKGKLFYDYYNLLAIDKKANLFYQVKFAYYNLSKAHDLYKVALASERRAQENHRLIQEKKRLGEVADFEVLRSESFVSQSSLEVLNAEKNLRIANEVFKNLLGIKNDLIIKPVTTPLLLNTDINFEDLWYEAEKGNFALKATKKFRQIVKTNFTLSILNILPSLSWNWTSHYQKSELPQNINDWKDNDIVSYGLRCQFFVPDFKSYFLSLLNARNEYNKAKLQERKSRLNLLNTTLSAWYSYQEAKSRYEYAQKNLNLYQELLRLAQEQYRLGLISQLELLNVEIDFNRAENNYYSALYDTYLNYAQLEYLIGLYSKR